LSRPSRLRGERLPEKLLPPSRVSSSARFSLILNHANPLHASQDLKRTLNRYIRTTLTECRSGKVRLQCREPVEWGSRLTLLPQRSAGTNEQRKSVQSSSRDRCKSSIAIKWRTRRRTWTHHRRRRRSTRPCCCCSGGACARFSSARRLPGPGGGESASGRGRRHLDGRRQLGLDRRQPAGKTCREVAGVLGSRQHVAARPSVFSVDSHCGRFSPFAAQ